MIGGSPQHEELCQRTASLRRVKTTALIEQTGLSLNFSQI